jgi:DNA-directed RNA polymerase specialized sigma24 family protein
MAEKDNPEELQAYVTLMTKHQSRLRVFIRSLLPGSPDVEDVLQNTNVVLWQKRTEFEHGRNFLAWADRIISIYRSKNRVSASRPFCFHLRMFETGISNSSGHFSSLSARNSHR